METCYKLHEIMMANICKKSFDLRSETGMGPTRCWPIWRWAGLPDIESTIARFRRSAIRLVR